MALPLSLGLCISLLTALAPVTKINKILITYYFLLSTYY